jgi:restriction endonuclease
VRLRFDPDQPHQRAAIDAVLGLVRGQPYVTLAEALAAGRAHGVVANRLDLPPAALLERVQAVQRAGGLPVCAQLPVEGGAPQISVEMETGTGKTYVYLRTVLELARRHGLRKVVIVVPSVAVREGVLHTLRATAEHFEALLPGLRPRAFAYDGGRLHRLRAFAGSAAPEIMVLTLDAFNRAGNRMRRPHDGFGGRAPLELLQAVRPLVVLDEPQRMESARSRAALADLAPILVLRYSATHRRPHALVHRLTPRQAFEQGLVKRIEVAAPAAGLHDRTARVAAQIQATVALHLRRQAELRPRGIKVLSLLFVERVADWVDEDGIARTALRRSFDALKREHPWLAERTAEQVSTAYFAVQRRGGRTRAVDSRTGRSAADEEAYALIMRDKARLLSLHEPVCFVVSHSALREGWDNPNVFQICTLAPSRTQLKQRQEVGRGVRLCVDQDGRRVLDPAINVLTVVANDSYEAYVARLQAEDAAAVGSADAAPPPRPVGQGGPVQGPSAVREAGAPAWRSIDAVWLRAEAIAIARRRAASRTVEPALAVRAPEPAARVTELLLRRRPPCLVSQPTIAAVIDALREPASDDDPSWWHVEAAAEAIVEALGEA